MCPSCVIVGSGNVCAPCARMHAANTSNCLRSWVLTCSPSCPPGSSARHERRAARPSGPGLDPGALPVEPTCATFAADEPPHAEASGDSPTTAANPSVRCSTVARPAAATWSGLLSRELREEVVGVACGQLAAAGVCGGDEAGRVRVLRHSDLEASVGMKNRVGELRDAVRAPTVLSLLRARMASRLLLSSVVPGDTSARCRRSTVRSDWRPPPRRSHLQGGR
jgi:hypothetical protein